MVGWYVALGILAALAALFRGNSARRPPPSGRPRGDQARVVLPVHVPTLKKLPRHVLNLEWLEGEVCGVLFFGFCGLVVFLVPWLDSALAAAGRVAC